MVFASDDIDLSSQNIFSETLSSEGNTFDNIQNNITSDSSSTHTIYLNNKTYVANNNKTITVSNKNLTIYGGCENNPSAFSTLNGNGLSCIFSITNSNVTLINIIFVNGKSTTEGGAISISANCNVTIINSTFINNSANHGGAVYAYENTTVFINNSLFINNSANAGGAISASDKINIFNSTFYNNHVKSLGGAVYSYTKSNLTISNSRFLNNSASSGGAVYTLNLTIIQDSIFANNSVNGSGGAVYLSKSGNISDSNFTNNSANDGGAIYIENTINSTISNILLINNSAKHFGGAVYTNTNTTFNNTYFKGNTANTGGAVYGTSKTNILLINSNFTNNSASSDGGAVYSESNLTVYNISFIKNIAGGDGGAIFSYITLIISNSTFKNNNATRYGGAISGKSDTNLNNNNPKISIYNSIFTENTAASGGAIYGSSKSEININLTTFKSNNATGDNTSGLGGAVYVGNVINLNNSIFSDNEADFGGAIYSIENITSLSSNFTNNIVRSKGGGLYVISVLIVDNSNFKENIAGVEGGAIYTYTDSEVNITDSEFNNNSADQGGAISVDSKSNINLNNNNFTSNSAISGGALFGHDSSTIGVNRTNFNNNSAEHGGAISIDVNSNLTVNSSSFTNNIANVSGGAIYGYIQSNITIESSEFTNNNASETGGAISGDLKNNIIIGGSDFTNNSAGGNGGAIGSLNKVSISDSTFTNNSAGISGGAIIANNITVSNSNFTNSSSIGLGSAIYGVNVNINGSKFKDKNSTGYYVVFVSSDGTSSINNTDFDSNLDNTNNESDMYIIGGVFDYLEPAYINVTVPQYAAGLIVVYDEGKKITEKRIDGIFNRVNVSLNAGVHNLTVEFVSETTLLSENRTTIVTILKIGSTINITNVSVSGFDVNITVKTSIDGDVEFTVNGNKSHTIHTVNNIATLKLDLMPAGLYNFTAKYVNNTNVNESMTNGSFKIDSQVPTINVNISISGFNVTFNISSNGFGSIEIIINGTSRGEFELVNGSVNKTFNNLRPDFYNTTIKFINNSYYSENSTTINFTILKKASNLEVTNVIDGANVTLTGVVFGDGSVLPNGTVSYQNRITGESFGKTNVTNGVLDSFEILKLERGTYYITATYSGDDYYNESAFIVRVIIGEAPTLNVTATLDIFDVNVTVNLNISGKVLIFINGESYKNVTITDGSYNFTLHDLIPDEYTVVVFFVGDSYYVPIDNQTTFTVNKVTPMMNLTPSFDNNNVNITVELDFDGIIEFYINDTLVESKLSNNKTVTFKLDDYPLGNYTITTRFVSNDYFNQAEKSINISIMFLGVKIEYNPVVMYVANGTVLNMRITDNKGNPLVGALLTITINGVDYYRLTDDNGSALMGLNGLYPNTYDVLISFKGMGDYAPAEINTTVTVLSTIIADDLNKIYKNDTEFLATLLDSQGNLLVNESISFNVNGIIYMKTTDENGTSKLNINLSPGDYIITVYNNRTGQSMGFTITVLPNMIGQDLTKYHMNESQFMITLLDNQGMHVGENVSVRFNINGVFYEKTTNEDGIALLDINLRPGTYILTAEYGDLNISYTITVLSTIESENLTVYSESGEPFIVRILDGGGNTLANSSVSFNIHGVIYHKQTNALGLVYLRINLMPGEYIITTRSESLEQSNIIKVI